MIPAVDHLAKLFAEFKNLHGQATRRACYAALHPGLVKPSELAPFARFLAETKQLAGSIVAANFEDLRNVNTPPAIFKAYIQLYENAMYEGVRQLFWEFLDIALANSRDIDQSPVEWAKTELSKLIENSRFGVELWIKEACDRGSSSEDLVEVLEWRDWRAPLLLAMSPSGNRVYDPAREWERQDEGAIAGITIVGRSLGFSGEIRMAAVP